MCFKVTVSFENLITFLASKQSMIITLLKLYKLFWFFFILLSFLGYRTLYNFIELESPLKWLQILWTYVVCVCKTLLLFKAEFTFLAFIGSFVTSMNSTLLSFKASMLTNLLTVWTPIPSACPVIQQSLLSPTKSPCEKIWSVTSFGRRNLTPHCAGLLLFFSNLLLVIFSCFYQVTPVC